MLRMNADRAVCFSTFRRSLTMRCAVLVRYVATLRRRAAFQFGMRGRSNQFGAIRCPCNPLEVETFKTFRCHRMTPRVERFKAFRCRSC